MLSLFPLLFAMVCMGSVPVDKDRVAGAASLAAKIDALTVRHWEAHRVQPASVVGGATFLRRVTLDLAGRVPTFQEATAFAADTSADKRAQTIRRLLSGPEYPLHLGRVLDEIMQEKFAGDPEFLEYLRAAVAEHKPWDRIFRDVLIGPWDTPDRKRADRFLAKRMNSLDELTNDTSRVFFGVNVSCAKCHDHPLVHDWTQDRYFGMASFFNRTQEASKGKNALIMEKNSGDLMFVTKGGEKKTARAMFLSGKVSEDPPSQPAGGGKPDGGATLGRRAQLVRIALEERAFFSRAIANRLWGYFLGRALVTPVDQMHTANPPAIPGMLELLADEFAGGGYDLDRVVAGLVSSRVYQLASSRVSKAEEVDEKQFALGRLRALTPHQYALSLVLATGDGRYDQDPSPAARAKRYRELEAQAAALVKSQLLDQRSERFQSSAGEALFMSNHGEIQKLVTPAGNNLVARLVSMSDAAKLVDTAVRTLLSRPPDPDERAYLVEWLDQHQPDRAKACSQLVWALAASAEFRFNH